MRVDIHQKIIKRDRIFEGKYLTLERLAVELPDGRIADREIVRVKNAVAVLPLDHDGKVHLVRQYRPAIERAILEVPAGLLDAGETPEDAARRECEEETGFRPHHLRRLIHYAHVEGYSDGFTTLFLGSELEWTGKENPDSTEIIERVAIPFEELIRRVETNQICDSKTILCALLTRHVISETR